MVNISSSKPTYRRLARRTSVSRCFERYPANASSSLLKRISLAGGMAIRHQRGPARTQRRCVFVRQVSISATATKGSSDG